MRPTLSRGLRSSRRRPGGKAPEAVIPWDDAGGTRLMDWLGVTEQQFRDPNLFALLIGRYAQVHYLPQAPRATLTDTVRNYREFLPDRFPLMHPSPLNFRWQAKNPWFTTDVLPELRAQVRAV